MAGSQVKDYYDWMGPFQTVETKQGWCLRYIGDEEVTYVNKEYQLLDEPTFWPTRADIFDIMWDLLQGRIKLSKKGPFKLTRDSGFKLDGAL